MWYSFVTLFLIVYYIIRGESLNWEYTVNCPDNKMSLTTVNKERRRRRRKMSCLKSYSKIYLEVVWGISQLRPWSCISPKHENGNHLKFCNKTFLAYIVYNKKYDTKIILESQNAPLNKITISITQLNMTG